MASLKDAKPHTGTVQHAKAKFRELLEACVRDDPQIVTKRGLEAAVLVPMAVWQRLRASARPSLKQLLLSDAGRGEFPIPKRRQARRRKVAESI